MPRFQINNDLDSQSHEMEEIIGVVPHWITRWGIAILSAVSIIGLSVSTIVKFPEMVTADVWIQAKEQPGKVSLTRDDASQEFLFQVSEGDYVFPGDTLFIHKNDKKDIFNPIITPMQGTVYISKGLDKDNTQDYLVWVIPPTTDFDVKIQYPVKGAGKVKVGQEVIIRLTDYPDDEFGFLKGKISSIHPVPVDDNYQAYVSLGDRGLVTHLDVELPIRHLMFGSGEILLDDKTIFRRIFGSMIP
ncbi:hypothetical protein ACFSKL_01235 [Belliella marina]|uniref:HlyD family secretion protein n=1 Tax=Belliella marina TaxID=1644146 RepID=A0ABW4VH85_9BACT